MRPCSLILWAIKYNSDSALRVILLQTVIVFEMWSNLFLLKTYRPLSLDQLPDFMMRRILVNMYMSLCCRSYLSGYGGVWLGEHDGADSQPTCGRWAAEWTEQRSPPTGLTTETPVSSDRHNCSVYLHMVRCCMCCAVPHSPTLHVTWRIFCLQPSERRPKIFYAQKSAS